MRKSSRGASAIAADTLGLRRCGAGCMVGGAVPPPTSAQFSLTLRVRSDHRPGMLGRVATAIGEAGGTIGDVELIDYDEGRTVRDITVDAGDEAHAQGIVDAVRSVDGAEVVDWRD